MVITITGQYVDGKLTVRLRQEDNWTSARNDLRHHVVRKLDSFGDAVLPGNTDAEPSLDRVQRLLTELLRTAEHVAKVATVQVRL